MTAVADSPAHSTALRDQVHAAARRARTAAGDLALATRARKDAALHAMSDALLARTEEVLTANARDIESGRASGMSEALIDRLTLTPARIGGIAEGLRTVAGLPDPIGEVVRGGVQPNGLEIRQVRVPMGVLGMVYEGRPNVTVDAAGLALKSGNAVLLRGSSSAEQSNTALVAILRDAIEATGLPQDAVQLLPCHDRASVHHLITARGLVDLVIPRGGAGLIAAVVEQATVPTVETGTGNCHVYVDATADLARAEQIVINSKARRPSVCNAAETLLVHASLAEIFLPRVLKALAEADVTVHGDESVQAVGGSAIVPATDADWDTEYLSLDIAAKVVYSLNEAIERHRERLSGT
jgi:glutamate-5-semialdehyde dehydrogenase